MTTRLILRRRKPTHSRKGAEDQIMLRISGRRKLACFIFVIVSVLLLTACQSEFSLWVIPGSTASSLNFGISETRNGEQKLKVNSISVFSCDTVRKGPSGSYYPSAQYAVWAAETLGNNSPAATNRIYYGKDDGWLQTSRGPEPLKAPGCYVVLAYAKDDKGYMESAGIGFKVEPDGKVVEMSQSEYKEMFTR